ncbi:type II toxin-antitoxin system Phd/YefM family antitoxin [Streptacidiphilus carbonis]|uniref:type II toxin-antitoxin system Phd/YefM family antitoxin n=1 Tax=Streptacidiphilus carbonis TaxID=105422 RepID=UPI0005A949A5|nr:type II toxin-antitoxin system prevent-host-death family antitoxin [Streptacidiphilus carbonis]
METIPLGEMNHNPAKITAKVRQGVTVILTEHGKEVIVMTPAAQSTSVLDRLAAEGKIRRAAHPGAMPELLDDLTKLPSLSDMLIAERDKERNR